MTDDDHTSETADAAPESDGRSSRAAAARRRVAQGRRCWARASRPSARGREPSDRAACARCAEPGCGEEPCAQARRPVTEAARREGRRLTRQAVLEAEGPTSPDAGRADGAGESCAGRGGALGPRRVGSGVEPARSGRPARGAGGQSRAGARADSIRAHARVAVHVLPWRGLPDGVRSRGRPEDWVAGPALRGCTPLQLRRIRLARPAAGLRRQRLRRDAAGPVRVGPEAARSELRDCRPGPRLRHQTATDDQPRSDPGLPEGDEELRGHGHARTVVRADRGGRDHPVARAAGGQEADQAGRP